MAHEKNAGLSDAPMTRRTLLCGLTGLATTGVAMLTASPCLASAPALIKGSGDFRYLHVVNGRTGEWLNTVYWVEGEYIPEALKAIDRIMRDWREDLVHKIDTRSIDILSATHSLLDCSEPLQIVSGYRCPKTNVMLRRKSKAVAQKSYHVKGMAVDIMMKTRSVSHISRAGHALRAGGVGIYSRSGFVHLDCGPVRKWGA